MMINNTSGFKRSEALRQVFFVVKSLIGKKCTFRKIDAILTQY